MPKLLERPSYFTSVLLTSGSSSVCSATITVNRTRFAPHFTSQRSGEFNCRETSVVTGHLQNDLYRFFILLSFFFFWLSFKQKWLTLFIREISQARTIAPVILKECYHVIRENMHFRWIDDYSYFLYA